MVMTKFTWFSIVAILSATSISASRVRVTQKAERATNKVASNKTSRQFPYPGGPQKYPTSDDKQGAKCCKRDAPELNGKGGSNGDGEVLMWFWTKNEKLGWGDCPSGWTGAWLSSSCDKYHSSLMNTADWDRDRDQRTEDFCGGGIGDPSCEDVGCGPKERCCFYMGTKDVRTSRGWEKEYRPWRFQCTATPCWQTPWLNGVNDPYLSSGYTVSLHKNAKCQGPAARKAMYHRRRGTLINQY